MAEIAKLTEEELAGLHTLISNDPGEAVEGLIFSAQFNGFVEPFTSLGSSLRSAQNEVREIYKGLEMREYNAGKEEAGVALTFL